MPQGKPHKEPDASSSSEPNDADELAADEKEAL